MPQNGSSETGPSTSGLPSGPGTGFLSRAISCLDRHPLVVATAFFIGATTLVTYPGVRTLSSQFWGMGDLWQHVWNFWWFDKALTELHTSPYFTEYQYYPTGASLASQSFSEFNLLLGIPLRWLFGTVLTYNLLVIWSYVGSGLGAYLLVHHVTKSRVGGLLAGLVFAFSPFRVSHLMFLHVQSTEWLPFFAWSLLRLRDDPRSKNVMLTALFLALSALCTWYYLLFLSLFAMLFLAADFWRRRRGSLPFVKSFAIGYGLALLLVLPFLLPLLRETIQGRAYLRMNFATTFSADLVSFFIPPEQHPVFARSVLPTYNRFNTDFRERVNYLGWVALSLAAYGLVRRWRTHRSQDGFWWCTLAVFSVLAMGPVLQINGRMIESAILPYALLENLPAFDTVRAPTRFVSMSTLAVAVTAGVGAASLMDHPRIREHQHSVLVPVATTLCLTALILFDTWTWRRWPQTPAEPIPSFYTDLAEQEGGGAILEVPLPQLTNPRPLYDQTFHEKSLVGGYVSRPPEKAEAFVQTNPFLFLLVEPEKKYSGDLTHDEATNAHELFSELDINWIVVHTASPTGDLIARWLREIYGTPDHVETGLVAHRVDADIPVDRFVNNPFVRNERPSDSLYATELFGLTGYKVKLDPGVYQVTLKFSEIFFTKPRERVFAVRIEGQDVALLDIVKEVGSLAPLDIQFGAFVEDGVLDIEFVQHINLPKLSGLLVERNGAPVFETTAAASADHPWDGNYGYTGTAGFYRTRLPLR